MLSAPLMAAYSAVRGTLDACSGRASRQLKSEYAKPAVAGTTFVSHATPTWAWLDMLESLEDQAIPCVTFYREKCLVRREIVPRTQVFDIKHWPSHVIDCRRCVLPAFPHNSAMIQMLDFAYSISNASSPSAMH